MDSSMTNKIIKARQYAEETDRIQIRSLTAQLAGDDHLHDVTFAEGLWSCDCEYFRGHRFCAHTMALERVFGAMVKQEV
jgi:hypothetical protein